jgi:hypothetical protein
MVAEQLLAAADGEVVVAAEVWVEGRDLLLALCDENLGHAAVGRG